MNSLKKYTSQFLIDGNEISATVTLDGNVSVTRHVTAVEYIDLPKPHAMKIVIEGVQAINGTPIAELVADFAASIPDKLSLVTNYVLSFRDYLEGRFRQDERSQEDLVQQLVQYVCDRSIRLSRDYFYDAGFRPTHEVELLLLEAAVAKIESAREFKPELSRTHGDMPRDEMVERYGKIVLKTLFEIAGGHGLTEEEAGDLDDMVFEWLQSTERDSVLTAMTFVGAGSADHRPKLVKLKTDGVFAGKLKHELNPCLISGPSPTLLSSYN